MLLWELLGLGSLDSRLSGRLQRYHPSILTLVRHGRIKARPAREGEQISLAKKPTIEDLLRKSVSVPADSGSGRVGVWVNARDPDQTS